jgi:hypothetical protein
MTASWPRSSGRSPGRAGRSDAQRSPALARHATSATRPAPISPKLAGHTRAESPRHAHGASARAALFTDREHGASRRQAPVPRSPRSAWRRPTCSTLSPSPGQAQHWYDMLSCVQGLRTLYPRTGRDGEWARLVAAIIPDFIDPATDGPCPGAKTTGLSSTSTVSGLP